MKRHFLLSFSLVFALAGAAFSQSCSPDSAALNNSSVPVYPLPESPDNPNGGINYPACVGKPFEFTLTFAVPDTFVYNGFPLPIGGVAVGTTGAILNSPAWLSYTCGPANCVFPKNTLGCIKLFGTPPPGTADSDINLSVKVGVQSAFGSIPLTVPQDLNLAGNYVLRTRQSTDASCSVSANDFSAVVRKAAVSPNPTSGAATLRVDAVSTEKAQLEIVDLFGRVLESRSVQLFEGENLIDLPTYVLPAGNFVFRLSNQKGRLAGKFSVQ